MSGVHHHPHVPFHLPVSVRPGSRIIISGTPQGGERFTVYLATGHSAEHSDIAFCFDVRFNAGSDHHQVIRNHKHHGSWGTEERKDYFPFSAHNTTHIVLKIKEDAYKVKVNDEDYCTHYCHIKPHHVTHLIINGDIKLHKVEVQD